MIIRLVYDGTSSRVTELDFAGGSKNFTQVWDDRASLVYS